ncbi:unnamed protein product [Ectocarpus fasciculatus]
MIRGMCMGGCRGSCLGKQAPTDGDGDAPTTKRQSTPEPSIFRPGPGCTMIFRMRTFATRSSSSRAMPKVASDKSRLTSTQEGVPGVCGRSTHPRGRQQLFGRRVFR